MFPTGFTSLSVLFLFPLSIALSLCTVFDAILSNIYEAVLINPSPVFVLGDFNIHHKDWLTYSGGIDTPGELCFNFPISNDLAQMVNFPNQIPDCESRSLALLDLFILMLVFVLRWLSLHWEILIVVVSVSINFLSNSKWDASFHCITYDYSRADWVGLCTI